MALPDVMTRTRLLVPASLALAAMVLVTGCGSTVQYQGTGTTPAGTDGLTTAPSAGTTGATDVGVSPGGSTGASGLGSSGSTGGTAAGPVPGGSSATGTTGAATTGSATGTSGPLTGRGFTRTTIRLGVATADDFNAFSDSFGLSGVAYDGNPNDWFKAAADDINKRGGLLGRRIELVKHNYNSAQTLNDPAGANQAACVTWTQDKPVAAVLFAGFLVEDTLLSCLGKAGVPLVYPGASLDYPLHYRATYTRFPLFFNLAQMVGERFDRIAIGRLAARHFFDPWDTRAGKPGNATTSPTKVGIIGFDDPDGGVQVANEKKELARNGVTSVNVIRCPRSLTSKLSCSQSAVLRFATDGVTHVFGAGAVFMQNADSQNYRPRYFVHVSAATFAANVPASQLNGAMGEGYIPFNDVAASDFPGDPTPATGACRKLMRDAGQASTNQTTLLLQMSVCDEFSFLEAAVKRTGSLVGTAVRAGLEGLGTSKQSALTWTSALSATEHTSARSLRDLAFRSDLKRFVYVSRTDHTDG